MDEEQQKYIKQLNEFFFEKGILYNDGKIPDHMFHSNKHKKTPYFEICISVFSNDFNERCEQDIQNQKRFKELVGITPEMGNTIEYALDLKKTKLKKGFDWGVSGILYFKNGVRLEPQEYIIEDVNIMLFFIL